MQWRLNDSPLFTNYAEAIWDYERDVSSPVWASVTVFKPESSPSNGERWFATPARKGLFVSKWFTSLDEAKAYVETEFVKRLMEGEE